MQNFELFTQLGLSENEARVYAAVLALKKGMITTIAKKAEVNRTSTYDVLKYLQEKGLVVQYIDNGKIGYTTDGPKRLKQWLERESRHMEDKQELLADHYDDIKNLYFASEQAPKFRYFEGNDFLEDFLFDSLEAINGENIGYGSARLNLQFYSDSLIKKYIKERYKRGIRGRFFIQTDDADAAREYIEKYYAQYLEKKPDLLRLKLLPDKSHDFLNETNIYDDKISFMHTGDDFFGVIIQDKQIVTTQRIIFESLWRQVKEEL